MPKTVHTEDKPAFAPAQITAHFQRSGRERSQVASGDFYFAIL
jgi:hypothetical protein